jgi:GT2 family glycosyltransferase
VFSYPNDFDGSKPKTQGVNEAAALRGLAVDYANKHNVKWILFVNPSVQLEPDTIEKLLAVKKPLVGAMICTTNERFKISGNNYVDRINFKNKWLKQSNLRYDGYIDMFRMIFY